MTKARTLADNFAADINAVTADAPLTGGGTSGTVTVGIQAGTTAQSGAVQLTDSTASTSTTTAATPNSVKSAYDLANGAIAKSTIDAKGDLLVGSANDTVSRLAVASTAGYVLTVDSAETTGLKWAAASSGALTKITSASFTTQSSVTIDNCFSATYKRYMMLLDVTGSTSIQLRMQFRYSTSTENSSEYYGSLLKYTRANTATGNGFVNGTYATILNSLDATPALLTFYFSNVGNTSERALYSLNGFNSGDSQASILGGGRVYVDRTYTGVIFTTDTGTLTGTYQIYGLEN